jgi:hypothetical protein
MLHLLRGPFKYVLIVALSLFTGFFLGKEYTYFRPTPILVVKSLGFGENKTEVGTRNCYLYGKYGTSCSDVALSSYNKIIEIYNAKLEAVSEIINNYSPTATYVPPPSLNITNCTSSYNSWGTVSTNCYGL